MTNRIALTLALFGFCCTLYASGLKPTSCNTLGHASVLSGALIMGQQEPQSATARATLALLQKAYARDDHALPAGSLRWDSVSSQINANMG